MTTKKTNQTSKEPGKEGILGRAAAAIGSALGAIAVKTGMAEKPAAVSAAAAEKKPSPPKKGKPAKKAAARKRTGSPRKKS